MEIGSLAKWVDELAGELQKIKQRANKLPIFSISDPEDGQAIIYDAASGGWVNGSATPPAPEPPTKYALIEQVDGLYKVVNPMEYYEDGTTRFITDASGQYLTLKTGAGVYTSYGRSINPVDLTDLDEIEVTFTAVGETHTETADISTYSGEWIIGVYYESTATDNSIGIVLFDGMTPQVLAAKVPVWTSTTGAGSVNVYGFVAEKSVASTRKKTTKKK